ncbi:uncharacterized protein [Salvelinus sp. IW2-2015]|uniref:uncharacterized protein n=1 Tax=Salvelinus sp. IW2-2015 TaxID=2691554 RepID=UPI000CDFCECF|nr:uncharacterized protein LOC111950160 [Salvelinus alpinus]
MNGSQVCLLLYSVVLMGYGANPDTTMGPSVTTGLTTATNQTSTTHSTRATSVTNIPATTNTPSRAYTKAHPNPCADCLFNEMDATILLIVTGCLVVLCTILLVSTVVLLYQVFHLKHQLCSRTISSRPTRSNVDLVSGSGHWGTGQKTKERPGSEPSETSLMMPELRQTQEGERGKKEEPEKEVKEQGKDETAKATPKKKEKEAATANVTSGSAENGASTPSHESPVTNNQPAEPSDPAATTASPSSQASSDVVVG